VDDADRAGRHRLVADIVIAEVSDDVGDAVAWSVGALPIDDRERNPPASEPVHDGTADEAATTRDQYATIDP
jgi:hypothetical protein